MAFKCTGFERAPSPENVHPNKIEEKCDGDKNSCFKWHYERDGDHLKFTTRIFVRSNLPRSERPAVLEHEHHHWSDFHNRAVALKAAVEKAIKEGREPALDDRLNWMEYDYCTDSAAFHRMVERFPIPICLPPGSARPE